MTEVINAFDPDLLGVQGVLKSQADFMTEALPGYGYLGVGWLDGKEDDIQVAILYRKSLFERLDQGHFWLSKTPDVPGSKSWLTTKPRMVSCVKLNTRTEPVQTVWFFKTHLTTISDNAKRESASIIHERMKSIAGSGAVILTGDFNTKACTEIYRLFLTNKAGLYPSDHFPVKAVLEIDLAE